MRTGRREEVPAYKGIERHGSVRQERDSADHHDNAATYNALQSDIVFMEVNAAAPGPLLP